MFHTHFFKKDGLNLYCICGELKTLKCSHKWKEHHRQKTKTSSLISTATQVHIIQVLICENCGDIKSIDLMIGEEIKNI